MKIKNVKQKVTQVLTKHPQSRDNDMSLLAIVWNDQLGGRDVTDNMTAFELLCLLSRKELSNPVSLRRSRQKIQEEQELLRGDKWKARQEHSKNVVEEIKSWDAPENQGNLF